MFASLPYPPDCIIRAAIVVWIIFLEGSKQPGYHYFPVRFLHTTGFTRSNVCVLFRGPKPPIDMGEKPSFLTALTIGLTAKGYASNSYK